MTKKKPNPHRGSSLDDFLTDEGLLEEATAGAMKRVLAWQFAQEMKEQGVTKAALARKMKTSRAQLDRLLDPENHSVTLKTITRAATSLGMRIVMERESEPRSSSWSRGKRNPRVAERDEGAIGRWGKTTRRAPESHAAVRRSSLPVKSNSRGRPRSSAPGRAGDKRRS